MRRKQIKMLGGKVRTCRLAEKKETHSQRESLFGWFFLLEANVWWNVVTLFMKFLPEDTDTHTDTHTEKYYIYMYKQVCNSPRLAKTQGKISWKRTWKENNTETGNIALLFLNRNLFKRQPKLQSVEQKNYWSSADFPLNGFLYKRHQL